MDTILIVGSGASGVHFSLSVLKKGYQVIMLDVGFPRPPVMNREDTFRDLKTNLSDPVEYFLGREYEAVVLPGSDGEYYGFPPNKKYVFSRPTAFQSQANGFEPLFSFAQGGLAEAWTGGVYPLNEQELNDLRFKYRDFEPYYDEVARRIGITGVSDDLAKFYPVHKNLSEPLRPDLHTQRLLGAYETHKSYLNQKLGCYFGRSRVAVLSSDQGDRKRCTYTGRCLWGCPTGALYTPTITLEECLKFPNFKYVPNLHVSHFKISSENRIERVVARSLTDHQLYEFTANKFVLAAGTLSSSKIFMDSIRKAAGKITQLTGLMDNRQVLIPFLNLSMIGERYNPENYQYHQIAAGIESGVTGEYFHALITTLKSALVHPILKSVTLDLPTSLFLFRNVRAGLGLVNLNFPDQRRETNFVTLQAPSDSETSGLVIRYSPEQNEKARIRRGIKIVKKALSKLGCVIPPGMIHIRPMGSSVHYAGTIPMSEKKVPLTSSLQCQSHDFDNLYLVDGTTFCSLPAKNLTFTLMANAIRVAEEAF